MPDKKKPAPTPDNKKSMSDAEFKRLMEYAGNIIRNSRYLEKTPFPVSKAKGLAVGLQVAQQARLVHNLGADHEAYLTTKRLLDLEQVVQKRLRVDQVAKFVVSYETVDGVPRIRDVEVQQGTSQHLPELPLSIPPGKAAGRYALYVWGTVYTPDARTQLVDHARRNPKWLQSLFGQVEDLRKISGAVTTPLTEEQLKRFNEMADNLKHPADEPAPAPAPAPPPEPEPEYDFPGISDELKAKLPNMVDTPPPPSPQQGDDGIQTPAPADEVGIASADGGFRAASVETGTEDEEPRVRLASLSDNLEQDVDALVRERAHLERSIVASMRRELDQIRPPAVSVESTGFRRGTAEAPAIDPAQLRALDGTQSPEVNSADAACFYAVLRAAPALAEFFAPALEEGYGQFQSWHLRALFGRFRTRSEAPQPGDMGWFASPMSPGGGAWGVVVEAEGTQVKEALLVTEKNRPFRLRKGGTAGVATSLWVPGTAPLLAEDSAFGEFWGPQMSRLRNLVSGTWHVTDFLEPVFGGTRYPIRDYGDVRQVLRRELRRVEPRTPIPPGCVLVGAGPRDVGVLMQNWNVLGMVAGENSSAYHKWERFGPRYVWYPHR